MMTHCPHCGKAITEMAIERPFTQLELKRFWSHVEKRENGCWIFNAGGPVYGRLRIGGRPQLAHVASWKIHNGSIPFGQKVMHNCPASDNPRCVNPQHLKLGSHAENMRDMVQKQRNNPPKGERNGWSKLKKADVLFIRNSLANGEFTILQLAEKLGVTFQSVYQISIGKGWAWAGGPLQSKKKTRPDLTTQQKQDICERPDYRGITVDLAKEFGINQSHISRLRAGKALHRLR